MEASRQPRSRRYRIERYLTEGGMGAIYIGKKLGPGGFEKEVVLKQLLPEYTSRPEFRDLFFREAKISATLDHANIVHTFDLVESSESLFIVMELVRGADLRTIGRRAKIRGSQLSVAALIQITLEVLAGLAYAHDRKDAHGAPLGIIHRDLSPSNVMCSVQGEVKLSDFGIAKAATHSSVFYRVRGKVGYMSPEQARSEPIDGRSDLFSVAVCLWEALAGERLFPGDMNTSVDQLYSRPIAPISSKRSGVPAALDAFLAKALALTPDGRYQDAVSMAGALRKVAHQHGLLFSAPELAEHLKAVLGDDPLDWLKTEDPSMHAATERPARDLPSLEGEEASSIGIVDVELEPSRSYDLQQDWGASSGEDGLPGPEGAPGMGRLGFGQATGHPGGGQSSLGYPALNQRVTDGALIEELDDDAPTGSLDVHTGDAASQLDAAAAVITPPPPPFTAHGPSARLRATPLRKTPTRGRDTARADRSVRRARESGAAAIPDPRRRFWNRVLALAVSAAAGAGVAFLATARDDRPIESLRASAPLTGEERAVSIWVEGADPAAGRPEVVRTPVPAAMPANPGTQTGAASARPADHKTKPHRRGKAHRKHKH